MSFLCEVPRTFCNLRDSDGYCRLEKPCLPIIDKCEGCGKIENGYCMLYIAPVVKWRSGRCPAATHIQTDNKNSKKIRVGQQKQKKSR